METLESTLEELNSNDGLAIELEVSTESCGRAETTFNLSTGAEDEDMTREEASPAIYVSGVGENDAIADMDTNMGCCASAVVISDDELMEQVSAIYHLNALFVSWCFSGLFSQMLARQMDPTR